jgi:hypothetical protein
MRLRPGVTYACHAGTIVHAYMGWTDHEVGPVDVRALPQMWRAAQEAGFFLPEYTSFGRLPVLASLDSNLPYDDLLPSHVPSSTSLPAGEPAL